MADTASELVSVTFSGLPDCWDTCGTCAGEEIEVIDVLVAVGDRVARYDPLIAWEASKTTLEFAAPRAGTVVDVFVQAGDLLEVDDLLLLLAADS